MKGYIEELKRKADEQYPPDPDDYVGDDGLLHCGKCHTPKQTRVHFPWLEEGELETVGCSCKCREEERSARLEAEKRREAEQRIALNRARAFSDSRSAAYTFALDDSPESQLSNMARRYADSFDPENSVGLLLYGSCGSGKSFIAACIVNAVLDRGFTARFTSVSEIESQLWEAKSKAQVYAGLRECDLLVIDDLAAERRTDYMNEILFNIIDSRYRSRKPMIVTTNLIPQERGADDISMARVLSRLYELTAPIKVTGKDRRKDHMRGNLERLKKSLEKPAENV